LRPSNSDGLVKSGPIRSSPITLLSRERAAIWRKAAGHVEGTVVLSHRASEVVAYLQKNGASFFDDMQRGLNLLPSYLEMALGELVTAGMISSDSFTGLRALLMPEDERAKAERYASGRPRKIQPASMAASGRWSLGAEFSEFRESAVGLNFQIGAANSGALKEELTDDEREEIAMVLLRRYGVVFRRLAEREANMPPWREMVRVFRRLEARGLIRGGRFVDGMWGEQYGLPEAVGLLRKYKDKPSVQELVALSAADPLNLMSVFAMGHRLSAITGNRVLYRDGEPIALLEGKEVRFLVDAETGEKWELQKRLVARVGR
jgi:ATP-dependent helicase Lhr and Lhr-like helicase